MRNNYLFYFLTIPIIYVLFMMSRSMNKSTASFFGFAENKETELSHQKDAYVKHIHITPGQEVKKGDLLMELGQLNLDYKIENVDHQMMQIRLMRHQRETSLINDIELLEKEKRSRRSILLNKIESLKADLHWQKSLFEDLESIKTGLADHQNSPQNARLRELEAQLSESSEAYDLEIAQKKEFLLSISKPLIEQRNQLLSEREQYVKEKELMNVYAPEDGLIGNILCKAGENVSSFSTLINFYEHNPTVVKGFVHENLIPQIKVGDSLYVSSSLHPELLISGKVSGLGSRIVEIPERLRKIPEFKTYGREIIIQIPKKNPFLQKEKVTINTITPSGTEKAFSALLFSTKGKKKHQINSRNTFAGE